MNIAEIAKLAGVSRAAVSRYFNNGCISETKREAIRRVVEETGYHPSLQAQTLRTRKTRLAGVIAPKIAADHVGKIIDGILAQFEENNYRMLLGVTGTSPEKELEYLDEFDGQVDGVILISAAFTPEHRKKLKAFSNPLVIIGQNPEGYPCVYFDNFRATYELTSAMIREGRSKLVFLGFPIQETAAGRERLRGYTEAVRDAGLPELAERHLISAVSMESGEEAMEKAIERFGTPDGVICASDEIAVGALHCMLRRGLRVPEDTAIAGHGDSRLIRAAGHGIKTVYYSYERSGELAARMLVRMMEGGPDVPQEIMLPYHLVEPGQTE